MYDSKGTLRIRAFTAGGALPIEGANVKLTGSDEETSDFVRSLITDMDGVAIFNELPAPNVKYSLSPEPTERPWANYALEVFAEGYEYQIIDDVKVFSGIESYQPLNLIPTTENN